MVFTFGLTCFDFSLQFFTRLAYIKTQKAVVYIIILSGLILLMKRDSSLLMKLHSVKVSASSHHLIF